MEKVVNVIGAGLAGVEASYFLAKRGVTVHLYEMRPKKLTPAHKSGFFAELVCSNSFKSEKLVSAHGLLKEELRHMDSLVMKIADETRVPSGEALSVDRDLFSQRITQIIREMPNIFVHEEEITQIIPGVTIIATGPLTSDDLVKSIMEITGTNTLSFFDASAPIIAKNSVNFNIAYLKSRYDQDEGSYINCPFNKEQYLHFYNELINAKTANIHEFDTNYFEGCMPIEVMAKRGEKTIRFGPLKPMGLEDSNGQRPYAVCQLRQDDVNASLYNIVGFQTNLTYKEQERVFKLIPGLENASFVRYGLMHRNTYVHASKILSPHLDILANRNVFFAGQLCGVEGYIESAASGLIAAINAYRLIECKEAVDLPYYTMIGCLLFYVTNPHQTKPSPMNANWGIMYGVNKDNKEEIIKKCLDNIDDYWRKVNE